MGLPSFFKILIDDFNSVLRLPKLFVKKFEGVSPNKALLETKYGESWSIKIEQIGEDYCFTHGWPQFVKYHQLEMYDLLLFKPMSEGKSIFMVSMFGQTACEKELNFGTASNSGPEKTVIDLENSSGSSVSKTVQVTGGNSSKSSSKMKSKNTSNNRAGSSDDFVAKRSPHFVKKLKKHNKYRIVVPIKFARANGILGKKDMTLVNSEGETWSVAVVNRTCNGNASMEMVKGWSDFWKKNRLMAGRRCVFEFIPFSDCFRVQLLGRD